MQGSLVALVTPFTGNQVDLAALERLVSWHIAQGTQGIVVVGTTGECSTVTTEEYRDIVSVATAAANKAIPVFAGATSNNPARAIELANIASAAGADGLLSAAGYYNRPNQAGLLNHFTQLHNHSDLPILLYNIPARTGVDIEPQTIAELAQLPRVVGVKDATKDLSHISRERQLISTPFAFLSGEDMTAVSYNAQGGVGCISVTANVAPALCAQMQKACTSGDYSEALRCHEQLEPLHEALFLEPSPAGIKYAMSVMGRCSEEVRAPILPLQETTKDIIRDALNRVVQ
ncbi:4-hydroxy-tetrahydrodipicolinate synthase [Reinekea sp. G2M2-21]|uniref:4-hydroxy-tetrahydrodipicolinate synthase n=1 Tax=Reinekea sp. G2M2-21 TaxID=2788942 RepID=UPI00351C3ED0